MLPLLARQLRPAPALPYFTSLQCSLLTFVALYLCRTRKNRRTARAPSPSSLPRCLFHPSVSFISPPWPPHSLPQHRSVLLAMCLHSRAAAYGHPCAQLCTMLSHLQDPGSAAFVTTVIRLFQMPNTLFYRSARTRRRRSSSALRLSHSHHCTVHEPAGGQGPGGADVPLPFNSAFHNFIFPVISTIQVGKDQAAQEFLGRLDSDSLIGAPLTQTTFQRERMQEMDACALRTDGTTVPLG